MLRSGARGVVCSLREVVGSRVLFLGSVCDKGGDEDSSIQVADDGLRELISGGLWTVW
jgi:hypothetical protein